MKNSLSNTFISLPFCHSHLYFQAICFSAPKPSSYTKKPQKEYQRAEKSACSKVDWLLVQAVAGAIDFA